MKNKIVLLIIMLGSFLLPVISQQAPGQMNEKEVAITPFTRLIVKSNLRVVLVENGKPDSVRIEGSKKFIETVLVLQSEDQLIIRSKSFKDLKKEGTIYIPVHDLQYLEVNADAKIVSYTSIRSPELKILINSDCVLSLVLDGKFNISNSDGFEYRFRRVHYNSNTPVDINNFINQ